MILDRSEVALRIFCAMFGQGGAGVTFYPRLGEQQIRVAFALADTFIAIASKVDGSTEPKGDPR